MHLRIIRGLLLCLAACSPAWAAPAIDVGTHYLLPNDTRTIAIAVSGGDQVRGLNFYIQVGDGGSINEGTDTKPKITGISIIGAGTLFASSNTGSQPMPLPDSGGTYLIWKDTTTTQTGVTLSAAGTLAYATIDTTGTSSSDDPYDLILTNVAANYTGYPGGLNTDFGDVSPTVNSGQIVIVDLHDMKWNTSNNGNWTNASWTGGPMSSPDYTANAIVDTAYTVNVASAQEANSLALSGGGKVAVGAAGSLLLTTDATIGNGSTLQVDGSLIAQNMTLNGDLDIVAGGSAHFGNISGTGDVIVGSDTGSATLTAASITANSLTLGAASGLSDSPIPYSPTAANASLTPVPEPSTITILITAALGILFYRKRNR